MIKYWNHVSFFFFPCFLILYIATKKKKKKPKTCSFNYRYTRSRAPQHCLLLCKRSLDSLTWHDIMLIHADLFIKEKCYLRPQHFHNIFIINHRLLIIISSNLNLPLKLLFYPTNNNL